MSVSVVAVLVPSRVVVVTVVSARIFVRWGRSPPLVRRTPLKVFKLFLFPSKLLSLFLDLVCQSPTFTFGFPEFYIVLKRWWKADCLSLFSRQGS
jgi:hypothetical protein